MTSEIEYTNYLKELHINRFITGIESKVPDIIYVVDDKLTAYKLYYEISSDEDYYKRINNIISILRNQPLKLNL